jgi:hypothetical protein
MPLPAISPTGVATAFIYARQTTSTGTGIAPQLNISPGYTNPPIIFEPPTELAGGVVKVWIIATGASANYGGCSVWVSIDNETYTPIGTILAGGIQGLLSSAFPSHVDPDTLDALSVDLTMSQAQLLAGTQQDADAFLTLCYCDGELIAYTGATLTGPYRYELATYIRRGCYGTTIGAHNPATQFGRIVASTFSFDFPANLVGDTLYFKFPAFNTWGGGAQALSDANVYTYTLTGIGLQNTNEWFLPFSVGGKFSILSLDSWDGNYEIFDVEMPVAMAFPANFATSPTPGCETAPGATVTLTFQTIHAGSATTVGTMVIHTSATTGAYSVTSGFTVPAGDRLRCYAPSGVDTTIAGVFGTIIGTWPATAPTPPPPPLPPPPLAAAPQHRPWLIQPPDDADEWTPFPRKRWRIQS